MKTLLVIVGLCLILCQGRIVEYRRPARDREVTEESYEEDYSDRSLEETSEDRSTLRERTLRASVYQPSYGFTKSYKRKYENDDDMKPKRPKYISEKSRGKYVAYGKAPQKSYMKESFNVEAAPHKSYMKDPFNVESGPHKSYMKDSFVKQPGFNPEFGDRKKEHRSLPRYEPAYQPPPPPPATPFYRPAPPKAPCEQRLLIGCTPTVTRVPCGYHAEGYHKPQYQPHQLLGSPGPNFQEESYQPPQQSYSPPPTQSLNPPPTQSYNPPPTQSYNPPLTQNYHPQPPQSYNPPASQVYQAPGVVPPPKTAQQTPPGSNYTPQRPSQHQQINTFYHAQYPQSSSYQPYQPTYKANDQQTNSRTPSFSSPVNEDVQDTAQPQSVSAFPTTTTTTPRLPTVPADRDQGFRFAESPTNSPTSLIDEVPNQKEASGDEPESQNPAVTSSTTPPSQGDEDNPQQ